MFSGKKGYAIIIGGIILLGVLVTTYVAKTIAESERRSLAQRSATMSAGLPPEFLLGITGTPSDVGMPAYENLKATLVRMRAANNDIRFVYVVGKLPTGEIFFYADSEPATSEDYSAPGDVYYEATPEFIESFENGETFVEGPTPDRWGTWISGISPIHDPATGEITGAIGMDVAARSYYEGIIVSSIIPVLLTIIALIVIVGGYRVARKEQELFRLKFRFLSIASHELRSPLAGIEWGTERILEKGGQLDVREKEMLTHMHDAAQYMSATVADVLDSSRFEAEAQHRLQLEAFDLANLIRTVARALSFNAARDDIVVLFDTSFPNRLPVAYDREKIQRIFSNVISNALKYSRPNSRVIVSYQKDKDGHLFSVKDEGIGIPQDEQDKIFSTYYRATNAERLVPQGTGLGLYFTKQLVDLHGGRIWFESQEDKGTTMHVLLPEKGPVV